MSLAVQAAEVNATMHLGQQDVIWTKGKGMCKVLAALLQPAAYPEAVMALAPRGWAPSPSLPDAWKPLEACWPDWSGEKERRAEATSERWREACPSRLMWKPSAEEPAITLAIRL